MALIMFMDNVSHEFRNNLGCLMPQLEVSCRNLLKACPRLRDPFARWLTHKAGKWWWLLPRGLGFYPQGCLSVSVSCPQDSPTMNGPRGHVEVSMPFIIWLWSLHSTSVIFYWSGSDRIHLDWKGGVETPLPNGRRIKEFVSTFIPSACLWRTLCLECDLLIFILHPLTRIG